MLSKTAEIFGISVHELDPERLPLMFAEMTEGVVEMTRKVTYRGYNNPLPVRLVVIELSDRQGTRHASSHGWCHPRSMSSAWTRQFRTRLSGTRDSSLGDIPRWITRPLNDDDRAAPDTLPKEPVVPHVALADGQLTPNNGAPSHARVSLIQQPPRSGQARRDSPRDQSPQPQ